MNVRVRKTGPHPVSQEDEAMVKTKLKPTVLYFGHDGTESGLYELSLSYGHPTRSLQSPLQSPVTQSAALYERSR
jgi:hypothetical protein